MGEGGDTLTGLAARLQASLKQGRVEALQREVGYLNEELESQVAVCKDVEKDLCREKLLSDGLRADLGAAKTQHGETKVKLNEALLDVARLSGLAEGAASVACLVLAHRWGGCCACTAIEGGCAPGALAQPTRPLAQSALQRLECARGPRAHELEMVARDTERP